MGILFDPIWMEYSFCEFLAFIMQNCSKVAWYVNFNKHANEIEYHEGQCGQFGWIYLKILVYITSDEHKANKKHIYWNLLVDGIEKYHREFKCSNTEINATDTKL